MTDIELDELRARAIAVEEALGRVVLGQSGVIRHCLICILSRGHVLLEGDVGVGKTTLLRAFARALGGGFSRIEGSIDMTPADLVYHTYIDADGRPRVEAGPLLAHEEQLSVFFFNEINRARPQVQALLLRAMTENRINAFNKDHELPYMIAFADRNRVEKGETFELAAATRDRFMMEVSVGIPEKPLERRALLFDTAYHDVDNLIESIVPASLPYETLPAASAAIQQWVKAGDAICEYAVNLMDATHHPEKFGVTLSDIEVADLVEAGASPRGMSLMLRAARTRAFLAERDYLTPDDIRAVFHDAVSHRIFFNPVYEFSRQRLSEHFAQAVLDAVKAP